MFNPNMGRFFFSVEGEGRNLKKERSALDSYVVERVLSVISVRASITADYIRSVESLNCRETCIRVWVAELRKKCLNADVGIRIQTFDDDDDDDGYDGYDDVSRHQNCS